MQSSQVPALADPISANIEAAPNHDSGRPAEASASGPPPLDAPESLAGSESGRGGTQFPGTVTVSRQAVTEARPSRGRGKGNEILVPNDTLGPQYVPPTDSDDLVG